MAYGDDAGFTAWLSANGYALTDGMLAPAVLRLRGSNYVDATYGARFKGQPTEGVMQSRAWPRTGIDDVPADTVPQRVIDAAYEAAWVEAQNPGSLSVIATPGQRVVRERVEGAVDVSYAAPGSDAVADATPILTSVEGLLWLFLRPAFEPAAMVV